MNGTAPLILAIAVLVMARSAFWLRQDDLPQPLRMVFRGVGFFGIGAAVGALVILAQTAKEIL